MINSQIDLEDLLHLKPKDVSSSSWRTEYRPMSLSGKPESYRGTNLRPFVKASFTRRGKIEKLGIISKNYVSKVEQGISMGSVFLNRIKLKTIMVKTHESDVKTLINYLSHRQKKNDNFNKNFKRFG